MRGPSSTLFTVREACDPRGSAVCAADRVAVLYRDALAARREHFTLIAFAIFAPGYGPDNHAPFAEVFGQARPD